MANAKTVTKKDLPKLDEKGITEAKLANTNKLKPIIVGVDTDPQDVLLWSKEGRKLLFSEDEDFLELSEEVIRALSPDSRLKYDMARNITFKVDVVSNIEDGLRGWEKDYNVIPGSASAQTQVVGKDPKFDYRWMRKDAIGRHQSQGFEVDHDPNIVAGGRKESCTYKTVGGQSKPELVLGRRPKYISEQITLEKRKKRESFTQATLDNYVETANQKGAIAKADSN
jgi:hypothetical protein